jgi:hypothetical protein
MSVHVSERRLRQSLRLDPEIWDEIDRAREASARVEKLSFERGGQPESS